MILYLSLISSFLITNLFSIFSAILTLKHKTKLMKGLILTQQIQITLLKKHIFKVK